MSILQQARLVESRKRGRWTYFRLDEDGSAEAGEAAELVVRQLKKDARIRDDSKRLKEILKIDPEQLQLVLPRRLVILKIMKLPSQNTQELRVFAREMGFRTLRHDGVSKATLGLTTIDEVLRVSAV